MKMKYIAGCYTVLMAAILFVMMYSFSNKSLMRRDMAYYNEQLKLVEQELENENLIDHSSRAVLERDYGCSLLLFTDEDYKSRMNELVRDGAVVLDFYDGDTMIGKAAWNEAESAWQQAQKKLFIKSAVIWGIFLTAGYALLLFCYISFVRPFHKLQFFSSQIAKGNFDFPLPMRKNNYFGAFTESFDLMREELKRAKESEYQANKSKKELVAELSHDMKTPIATIKAACEVIQVKEENPDTLDKVSVIAAKADTIDRLIGNMFHATLEELEVLKVEPCEESSLCVMEMLRELRCYGEIVFENDIPECLIFIDKLRLEQVVDNIINNAYKYAGSAVFVSFYEKENGIRIRIRDEGKGVPEEELALLTEKYYRGSNAKGKAGSGLGLYLSKVFMQQMRGDLECYHQDGFVVELYVRKI